MNKSSGIILFLIATSLRVLAVTDPVGDYLSRFSPLGGDNTIYSSDTLLRLDLDLNGDGQKEVLLSMARDRNAKQGNVWAIYSQGADGYATVGAMTFNSSRFYVGPIDELNRYGLVTFWPGGRGEGTLAGYLFDGATIRQVQVAAIVRDAENGEIRGQDILDKYMNKAVIGDEVAISIDAETMTKQYGVKVDAKTYRQMAEDLSQSQQAKPSESPSVSPGAETTRNAQVPVTSPARSPIPRAESETPGGMIGSHETRWFVISIVVIAAIVGIVIYWRSRK